MKFTKDDIKKSMLLYVITDRSWLKDNETLYDVCEDILRNNATFLQIREKDLDYENFVDEALKLKSLCLKYKVPFVINDNVEIALQIDADGVHVGQSDMKDHDVRSIIGEDKILGISASTVEEAIEAEKKGADYIGVGAVFTTSTKKDAFNITIEQLKQIVESVSIPVVAIGGINKDNIKKLKGSKVEGVAVISAIFAANNPGLETSKLLELSKQMTDYE